MPNDDKADAGGEFIVKLEGVELTVEARAALVREIEAVTLRELAKFNLETLGGVRIPRKDWLRIEITDRRETD